MGRAVAAGILTALVLSAAVSFRPDGPSTDSAQPSAAVAVHAAGGRHAAAPRLDAMVTKPAPTMRHRARPKRRAGQPVARARAAFPRHPVTGFDTCNAPSLSALNAWRGWASVVAVYIGGANRACANRNLSASWVHDARAVGWHLVPVYVGLQPSCDRFGGRINPVYAAGEGRAAADDAMTQARELGIRREAPLYFDMEAYNSRNAACRGGVLTFLDGWTRQLHAHHYVSGVYTGAGSGALDLSGSTSIGRHALAKPDSIWVGYWDGKRTLTAGPYLPSGAWSGRRRIKQYQGPHWETHGKVRLNIDSDVVYGSVY